MLLYTKFKPTCLFSFDLVLSYPILSHLFVSYLIFLILSYFISFPMFLFSFFKFPLTWNNPIWFYLTRLQLACQSVSAQTYLSFYRDFLIRITLPLRLSPLAFLRRQPTSSSCTSFLHHSFPSDNVIHHLLSPFCT